MKKKKRRKSGKGSKYAGKGSKYERVICKKLSLWWTNGQRDDVFWRTAGSGARAKTRGKKGRSTFGQYGDVQAIDPIGQPLIDLFTIEIKRGYTGESFANLIERHQNPKVKGCQFQRFIEQAEEERVLARTPYWLLICKRNARVPIIVMPYRLYHRDEVPDYTGTSEVTYWDGFKDWNTVIVVTLEEFLQETWPNDLKRLWKRKTLRKKKKKTRQ